MNRTLSLAALALSTALIASAGTVFDTSLASPNGNPATPGCYTGTGCVNSGFTVSTGANGTELGLSAILRFVGPVTPTGNVYDVPTGTAGGSALWDYTFSIDTQPNGVGTDTLSNFTYSITLTDLNTLATLTGNPLAIPDDAGFGAGGKTNGLVAGEWGAQNSENFSFAGLGTPGFNPNAIGSYTIELDEFNSDHHIVNSVEIQVNAGTPEPASLFLMGGGLLGLGLIARKKAAKA
jgi:PEP-CTERM motif